DFFGDFKRSVAKVDALKIQVRHHHCAAGYNVPGSTARLKVFSRLFAVLHVRTRRFGFGGSSVVGIGIFRIELLYFFGNCWLWQIFNSDLLLAKAGLWTR
ncbi:MAG: hypothetical protein V3T49_03580, partial [Dehalococcoidia bacterium]